MTKKEAIILAGGFGARLSHVVKDVPKPMAPVSGRPFLRYLLDGLADNQFGHIVIADGYLKECIESYFGKSYRGLEITYSQEVTPLLTGGAVKQALYYCNNDWVYVFNGDTYLDLNYSVFEGTAKTLQESCSAIIAIKQMHNFERYGSVLYGQGKVTGFTEKKYCSSGFINAGVYKIKRDALETMPDVFSLETDYFESACENGLVGYVDCDGLFIDIGVPKDYETAQTILAPLKKDYRIAFFDRDGTINVDTGHLYEPEKLKLIESCIEKICYYNFLPDFKVVVVTNQAGIAKGLYTISDMNALHEIIDSELLKRNAHIDAYYYCPHHPDFTGECACRKPKPGMLEKVLFDFEASPEKCVMFGDKKSDELAALSCGISFSYIEGK